MDSTALLNSLSRPASPARKVNPTRKQILYCLAGITFLAGSILTLASLNLSDRQFILGMLLSGVATLWLVGKGFVAAIRDDDGQ